MTQITATVSTPISDVPFSIEAQLSGNTLITAISGELDLATATLLENTRQPFEGKYTSISYELADLTFVDCTGLHALLAPANGNPVGPTITITSASRCVHRLLELLQMQSLLEDSSP